MIQAHKALDTAARTCEDAGTIYFLAECEDGLGREDFLQWFDAENCAGLSDRLCERYQVNGQTAWALLRKAESFDIRIVTNLDEPVVHKMRLKKADPSKINLAQGNERGYILPNGAKFRINLS
jgi:hypothetical protein